MESIYTVPKQGEHIRTQIFVNKRFMQSESFQEIMKNYFSVDLFLR